MFKKIEPLIIELLNLFTALSFRVAGILALFQTNITSSITLMYE